MEHRLNRIDLYKIISYNEGKVMFYYSIYIINEGKCADNVAEMKGEVL